MQEEEEEVEEEKQKLVCAKPKVGERSQGQQSIYTTHTHTCMHAHTNTHTQTHTKATHPACEVVKKMSPKVYVSKCKLLFFVQKKGCRRQEEKNTCVIPPTAHEECYIEDCRKREINIRSAFAREKEYTELDSNIKSRYCFEVQRRRFCPF